MSRSSSHRRRHAIAALFALLASTAHADTLTDAISGGQVNLDFRPRYEFMSQADKNNANAFTVQTLLGLASKPIAGISADLQFINVAGIVNHYNSLRNRKAAYALIPDPEETNVNQAYLQYAGIPALRLRAGRQEINLDDERFVGAVGFRQTPQSFDAVSVQGTALPDLTFYGAYIWRIKNILNENVPSRIFLSEVSWTPSPLLHAQTFGYGYGNQAHSVIPGAAACFLAGNAQACNSTTLGVRVQGAISLGDALHLPYDLSYAKQLPYDGGSAVVNAQYYHVGAGLALPEFWLHTDYMVMGTNSQGNYGFQTPLATKHAFNGWAEVFLTTPPEGLRSLYFTLGGELMGTQLAAIYYDFQADREGAQYGHELDLSATHVFFKHWSAGVQYADYRRISYGMNTEGTWVFVTAKF
ncbi:alginate export family protein [Acidithiobacillus sp.]|uniref:alginate export family protein n=1 Tax=Acidithiobacillus sp. TaxID=1872118 RepID=UPI0025BBBCF2|nr:alginate export family protein [Acidithiobacillus sp.]MCK9189440.1 alginate export family protein [Acidithiobacillus sp.]MCK9358985.1 alginate export family protein [Acidithiobacillus sp.]